MVVVTPFRARHRLASYDFNRFADFGILKLPKLSKKSLTKIKLKYKLHIMEINCVMRNNEVVG